MIERPSAKQVEDRAALRIGELEDELKAEREIARRERKRVHRTENAARKLWEAATEHWLDDDEDWSLGERLLDSAAAYPGIPIKGKDLYKIGVELGFIEDDPPH